VIVLQTWLSPLQGYLVDKFGARLLISIGCLLSGLGWVASAYVTSLAGLYFTYGLFCGVRTGIVYIGIIGLMVRWFPDRRGCPGRANEAPVVRIGEAARREEFLASRVTG
jgi:OFA family oxalate/formate antiporter-like MFS transporter